MKNEEKIKRLKELQEQHKTKVTKELRDEIGKLKQELGINE
jgi:hypothetical protein